jgi:exodeoxyribonuclease V alpha subunit
MDTLCGYVNHIVFGNDSGFTVARLKVPNVQEEITIVGLMPSIQPGETILCKGQWKQHPQHGRQFEVASFDPQAPSDLIGIQKYLESGMIKGIGPIYAEKIVKTFGIDTLKIIDESPKRLLDIPGLGEKRVEKIISCWQEHRAIRNVMVFLRGHHVSAAYAQKIYKAYGEKSIEKVTQNPYALAKEIFGIGFKTADGIAKGLGISSDSPLRVDAGIEHIFWELSNEGHTCFPQQEFLPIAESVLEVPASLSLERIEHLVTYQQSLVKEKELLWVKPFYLAELGIAKEVQRLLSAKSYLRSVDIEKALEWSQQQLRLTLAKEQAEAVALGLQKKMMIITGGPGTGKSTITKAILRISEKLTSRILLAAPTGRAAKRMTEITHKKAFTIHSLLEMDFTNGKFKKNKENPLACDLIIIDEASMIDTLLMYHLLKAIPDQARVIFIGDVDQLPSVGAGNVLKDLIQSEVLSTCQLKKIFRQAAYSKITMNAHRVNQGFFPDIEPSPHSDFLFISKESPEEVLQEIIEQVTVKIPSHYAFNQDKIQVLSPMKKGIIGTENMNGALQKVLNPNHSPLVRMGRAFHLHDKVMQIRNNYQKEVYNGDVGKISSIDLNEQILKVSYEEKIVEYDFDELDELVHAYAVSIHKYQGSECPCIVIPIHTSHFKLLNRNLLYTGITRGKKLVILIGTKKALAIAVKNEEARTRHTGLKNRIHQFN